MLRRCIEPWLLASILLGGCAAVPDRDMTATTSPAQARAVTAIDDVEGVHREALALMADEDWRQAAEVLESLTAARPGLSGPWTNLGIVRTMLGDQAAAETAFKRALEANAANAEAWNQLGMLYRRSGRLQEARAAYNSGLQQSPGHADLHWNLAILHDQHLPDAALALSHYEQYRSLSGSNDPQLAQWIAQLREQVPPEPPAKMTAEANK